MDPSGSGRVAPRARQGRSRVTHQRSGAHVVGTLLLGSAHANVAAVSTAPTRVFVARLVGLPIFDPQGDQVAKVRDLVVAMRSDSTNQPRVLGMVAEVFG